MKLSGGPIIAVVLAWLAYPSDVRASEWQLIPEESRLTFQGSMLGMPVVGVFEGFSAEIEFDPDAPAAASVTVTIDMNLVETHHDERDHALGLPEWFSTTAFPQAHFSAQGFREASAGRYVTDGTLTVRGVSRQVTLPFELNIANGRARMTASLDLRRDDFKIGQDDWASDAIVSYDVRIDILIAAQRAP